ncbi:MAG: putative glycolipid-binding domain-containing protein [Anaerolineae bacterium]
MTTEILWQTVQEPGLEHLSLDVYEQGASADGSIIGISDGQPFRLRYVIQTDSAFQIKSAQVSIREPFTRQIELRRDAFGVWTDKLGLELPHLNGCVDLDLETTPFTNTLPIRRLNWKIGETQQIEVAYIHAPSLTVSRVVQHYTCLEMSPDGGLFRFESRANNFTADVRVDAYGLVVEYGNLWKRVHSG